MTEWWQILLIIFGSLTLYSFIGSVVYARASGKDDPMGVWQLAAAFWPIIAPAYVCCVWPYWFVRWATKKLVWWKP